MSEILATPGEVVPLTLVLADGVTSKFPLAIVYPRTGSPIPVFTAPMAHVANGYYHADFTVPAATKYIVVYITYDDAGFTIESPVYTHAEDFIVADAVVGTLGQLAEAQCNIAYDDTLMIFRCAAWMDREGETILIPTSCTITVRDQAHALVFTSTSAASTNGVFVFEQLGVTLPDNKVGYVQVSVTDGLGTADTVQSFSTVA